MNAVTVGAAVSIVKFAVVAPGPALPAVSVQVVAKVNTFDVSVILVVGVNVPVQVMLSPDVIEVIVPFTNVISSAEENPATASENTNVTVDVSPLFNDESDRVKEVTDGAVVSITMALVSAMLFAAGTVVLDIALPAASVTVPIVKLLTVRSVLVSPAAIV